MSEKKEVFWYEDLSFKGKLITEMYAVAVGFLYAVDRNEMIVSPSEDLDENGKTILKFGSTKIPMRGNKSVFIKSPYTASSLFACDVYLKTILTADDFDFKSLKVLDIITLYKNTNENFKKVFLKDFRDKYDQRKDETWLESEIMKLSNMFQKLRYSDETINRDEWADGTFFYWFCEFLDEYTRQMIFEYYGFKIPESWWDRRVHRKESSYFINRHKKNSTKQREEEIL